VQERAMWASVDNRTNQDDRKRILGKKQMGGKRQEMGGIKTGADPHYGKAEEGEDQGDSKQPTSGQGKTVPRYGTYWERTRIQGSNSFNFWVERKEERLNSSGYKARTIGRINELDKKSVTHIGRRAGFGKLGGKS